MKYLLYFLFNFIFVLQTFAQQPNILLVILDDVGVGEIPGYEPLDATKAVMPNLEALMDKGLKFDKVWSNPVCAPSRANIITGKHGFRTDVLNATSLATLDRSETTLQAYINELSNDAYSTALIGKWHLGGTAMSLASPNDVGIDYVAGVLRGGVQDYSSYSLLENGQESITTEYTTTKFSDLAINWIAAQDQPWFCWLAYNAPHTPIHLPPVELHSSDGLSPDQADIDADPLPYFLAMVESVDTEMGRVIASILPDELDNTVIIVVGDNGTSRQVIQRPYRKSQSKGTLYQGGVHVPMVVAGKGVERIGESEAALVSFSDLFSTIVEISGHELDIYENSYSFHHLLAETGMGARECSYTESAENLDSITWASRGDIYKYMYKVDSEEFYNLDDDPYEANNLLPLLTDEEQIAYDKLSQFKSSLVSVSDAEAEINNRMHVFPNPAREQIVLMADQLEVTSGYSILNQRGQVVLQGKINGGKNIIDINRLFSGKYYIKVADEKHSFIKL